MMEYAPAEERTAQLDYLNSLLLGVSAENFNAFDIYNAKYESAGRAIGADILVPKKPASSGPRPVMVRIHGGFLVTGSSLFPAWFSKWILDYAESQSAIIVSPDYRLLPEAKGTDILEDIGAFWEWFKSDGPDQYLKDANRTNVSLDKEQLLLLGESAGGYLAVQSMLSGFVRPRAAIAIYPMLDLKADHYTKEYSKPIIGVPNFPMSFVDETLAAASLRDPITSADPPERVEIAIASVQTGRFLDYLGSDDPELFPLDRLRDGQHAKLPGESIFPPLFVLHGESDSAVPAEGTRRLLEVIDHVDPRHRVRAAFRPGDHGFDGEATLEDGWLREGLNWISSEWLNDKSQL